MPKKRKREPKNNSGWKKPCLTTCCLLLLLGITAVLLQRGILRTEHLRGVILLCCFLAGLTCAVLGRKGEGGGWAELLNPGIPAFLLLAASLCAGDKVELKWPLLGALLLMLPSLPVPLRGSRRNSYRRSRRRKKGSLS